MIRQYSVKANDVPAVIAHVASHGFGANVVSRGEWALARRGGVPNDRITLEGSARRPPTFVTPRARPRPAPRCAGSR